MASKQDIAFHYDVDNDFYSLFLDSTHQVYSCAVWEGATTLEQAQQNKLARLSNFSCIGAGDTVLDIGCGWGGMMKYAIDYAGAASATGVTLSEDQYRYVSDLNRPDIEVHLVAWQDFKPQKKFDALVSIGAFEHFASLEDRDNGRHRQVYTDFFDWCRAMSTSKGRLGLQTIVTSRAPENLQELRDTRYLLEHVFPGSALPTASDLQAGIQDQYEIVEARQIGLDYAKTLSQWRDRLNAHKNEIQGRYGEDLFAHYDRYFLAAERSFKSGVVNLLQLSLAQARPVIAFGR